MKRIRVLVANHPRLMRELIMATISDQTDIEIVGEVEEESELLNAVKQTQPEFLIVALEDFDRLSEACTSILQSYPQTKVVAIAPNRDISMFYWASLRVQSNQIETSETGLLSVLRGKSQPPSRSEGTRRII